MLAVPYRKRPLLAADTLGQGMGLLGAYSAGLAVPFLLAAWAVDSFLEWFQKFRRKLPWVVKVSGALRALTPEGLLDRLQG